MKRIRIGRLLLAVTASLTLLTSNVSAAETPMLKKYVNWDYGKTQINGFSGYIPALEQRVADNPWQLDHWAGLFTFIAYQPMPKWEQVLPCNFEKDLN